MAALSSRSGPGAESDAAFAEVVSAATRARIRWCIADPVNAAIRVAAPFSGADIGADFVILVANQEKAVDAEQAKAHRTVWPRRCKQRNLAAAAAATPNWSRHSSTNVVNHGG